MGSSEQSIPLKKAGAWRNYDETMAPFCAHNVHPEVL